jgi:rubrerythrin
MKPLKVVESVQSSKNEDFWYELLLDLTVEAERLGSDPKKEFYERYILPYLKRKKHFKSYNWRIVESKTPYTCPKCGYVHYHSYVIGKKPKRCRRCHQKFSEE